MADNLKAATVFTFPSVGSMFTIMWSISGSHNGNELDLKPAKCHEVGGGPACLGYEGLLIVLWRERSSVCIQYWHDNCDQ